MPTGNEFRKRCLALWRNIAALTQTKVMINYPRDEFVIIGGDGHTCQAVYCWPEGAAIIAKPVACNDD